MTTTFPATQLSAADWQQVGDDLDAVGCASTPRLLTPAECRELADLYERPELFRSTIDMARHRFGSGQYRYFTHDLPEPVRRLREAFYPHLVVIARAWAERLGRLAPWPDTLGEWLELCHGAGQSKSSQILLRYQAGDWNALHRDLFGDLVFPLQVVIGLDEYGTDYTGGEFLLVEQRPRAQSRGTATVLEQGRRPDLHHPRPSASHRARLVRRSGPAWRQHRPFRPPPRPGPGLPRRLARRPPG